MAEGKAPVVDANAFAILDLLTLVLVTSPSSGLLLPGSLVGVVSGHHPHLLLLDFCCLSVEK
jgi:hypothetical protein